MSLPQVFTFDNTPIRWEVVDGKPYACAVDVCAVLGYKNSRKAVNDHCNPKGVTKRYTPTDGGDQELTWISEGNVVRLIARSKLPQAEAFEQWVFDTVIPTVINTGSYSLAPAPAPDQFQLPRTFAEALALAATIEAEKEQMAAKIALDAPKVEFAKQIANSRGDISIGDAAKALNDPSWKKPHWGRDRLFDYLRKIRWVEQDKRDINGKVIKGNSPTQRAIESGYMRQRLVTIPRESGDTMAVTPFLTSRGIVKLWMKMKEDGLTVSHEQPTFEDAPALALALEKPDQKRRS